MLSSTLTIEPWMTKLGLRGGALLIYAYIYYQSYEGYAWCEVDDSELSDFADGNVVKTVAQLVSDNLFYWEIHEGKPVVKPNINTIYERAGQAYIESKR